MSDLEVSANEIVPGLWIGNEDSAISKEFVTKNRISLIINCTKDVPMKFQDLGVEYIRIPVDDLLKDIDTKKMTEYLPVIVPVIERALSRHQNVLVHCHQGVQRSAIVVTAYVLKLKNLKPQEAIDFVVSRRKEAFFGGKYINFIESLEAFHKSLQTP